MSRNAEIVKGIPDPCVSPRLVLIGDFQDKISYFISLPWPSESFGYHAQSARLSVRESETMSFSHLLVHPDLFGEIINDLPLIFVNPSGYEQDEESQIV